MLRSKRVVEQLWLLPFLTGLQQASQLKFDKHYFLAVVLLNLMNLLEPHI